MIPFDNFGASKRAIQKHYDLGNEFYQAWLGRSMCYSAAMWLDNAADNLDEAQYRKLDWHIHASGAAKAKRVLDVGCGWGSLLFRLRERTAVEEAIGLTLSDAQAAWIKTRKETGIRVVVSPWQEFGDEGRFGSIISIGAFEHFVSPDADQDTKIKAYRAFFEFCATSLEEQGRLSLQTIGWLEMPKEDQVRNLPTDLFPESNLPYLSEIVVAAEERFNVSFVATYPTDYPRTLRCWIDALKKQRDGLAERYGASTVKRYIQNFMAFVLGFEQRKITLCRMILEKRRRFFTDNR